MSVYTITYISVAGDDVNEDDIIEILNVSRENNREKNVTGMLLLRDDYFIQALEGEEKAVKELYEKIARDPRHSYVLKVHEGEIDERAFGEWAMGFQDLGDMDTSDIEGYTDFLDQPFDTNSLTATGSRARALLELFKEPNR